MVEVWAVGRRLKAPVPMIYPGITIKRRNCIVSPILAIPAQKAEAPNF
jgi:hypothetical protein